MIVLCDMIDGEENLSKFHRIYEKYKNTMYSVGYTILNNQHDAEDVVENALIKVIDHLYEFDTDDIEEDRCKNLIITITRNAAIDYWRKNQKEPVPCEYIESKKVEQSAETAYFDMENYKDIISCINELEDIYKDVLRLRMLHHLSAKETGKILNIAEKHVNVRFMRAKATLARKLEERKKNE